MRKISSKILRIPVEYLRAVRGRRFDKWFHPAVDASVDASTCTWHVSRVSPRVTPAPMGTWEYVIPRRSWNGWRGAAWRTLDAEISDGNGERSAVADLTALCVILPGKIIRRRSPYSSENTDRGFATNLFLIPNSVESAWFDQVLGIEVISHWNKGNEESKHRRRMFLRWRYARYGGYWWKYTQYNTLQDWNNRWRVLHWFFFYLDAKVSIIFW